MSSPRRITQPRSRLQKSPSDSGHPDREELIRRARKKRRRRRIINIFLLIGITAAIGLFIWAEQNRRSALSQLRAKESELEQIEGSSGLSEEEVSQVLEKVGKLIVLPSDPKPSVATIINVADLRATSDFYNQAENGDFLVITDHRAILFDPEREIIVDVVPLKKVDKAEKTDAPAPVVETVAAATPTPPASAPPTEPFDGGFIPSFTPSPPPSP